MRNTEEIIGEWLREQREKTGRSLQQVAERYGVSRSTISCWENAKRSISAKDLVEYSRTLDADLDELADHLRGGVRV